MAQAVCLCKHKALNLKQTNKKSNRKKGWGGVTQVVERMPSKHKALNSTIEPSKKKKKTKKD
jgi:hypothetical protein